MEIKGGEKMTNSELLKKKIDEKGLKINFIVKELGISRTALYHKINNNSYFNQNEIQKLCKLLAINKTEKEKIFFAENVN